MQEIKTKPGYNAISNVGWMIETSWKNAKSVIFFCVAIAVITVAHNLSQLLIVPKILERVENRDSVHALIATILIFSGILFFLTGLKRYLTDNAKYGRIELRSVLSVMTTEKTNTTSYQNLLDPSCQKLMREAKEETRDNRCSSEHIWTTITTLLSDILGFITYLVLLKNLDPIIMIAVIITTCIGFLISIRTDNWRYEHREKEADYKKKTWYIIETAESIPIGKDIRIFGLSDWFNEIWTDLLRTRENFAAKAEKQKLIGNIANVALSILRNGIAYVYLISMVINNGLSASDFVLHFTAVSGFSTWITGFLSDLSVLHKEGLGISKIREYLEMDEVFLFEGGKDIPDLSNGCKIELKNVSFRYPEADQDTIRELDLEIAPGEKLAVVGLNGAGKTTLVKLICGLLDPTNGSVSLNGTDIRDLNRREYYKLFSTLFQSSAILDVSIAENVAQRIEGIDRDRVFKCLSLAGLSEKVEELPDGMDTKLGKEVWEGGVELSGGQVQRLLLARALYRDAPMLILDEPTAALDPIAESDLYQKYSEMTKGKTAVFVSHRLATTRFCDRIIFISDGRIAETGTHEQLLSKRGKYAELFEVQSRYYKEGKDF